MQGEPPNHLKSTTYPAELPTIGEVSFLHRKRPDGQFGADLA